MLTFMRPTQEILLPRSECSRSLLNIGLPSISFSDTFQSTLCPGMDGMPTMQEQLSVMSWDGRYTDNPAVKVGRSHLKFYVLSRSFLVCLANSVGGSRIGVYPYPAGARNAAPDYTRNEIRLDKQSF